MIKKVDKEKKKLEKKDRLKKSKSELRQKMSVIASSDMHNQNDEVLLDRKTFEKLQEVDIEADEYIDEESEGEAVAEEEADIMKQRKFKDVGEGESEEDEESDEDVRQVNRMNKEVEEFYKQKKEY